MTKYDFIQQASCVEGPGHDGYAFQDDVYCIECGNDIIIEKAKELAGSIESVDDPKFRDSNEVPQPIFFGKSKRVQRCVACKVYLYGGK